MSDGFTYTHRYKDMGALIQLDTESVSVIVRVFFAVVTAGRQYPIQYGFVCRQLVYFHKRHG